MTTELGNRWRIVAAALVMQLCLNVLYSWAVFRGPLEELYGWSKSTSIAPFRATRSASDASTPSSTPYLKSFDLVIAALFTSH